MDETKDNISRTGEIREDIVQINWSSITWPCYHCNQIFNDYKTFSNHQQSTHQIIKVEDTCYQCYECGEPVFKYTGFLNHIRSAHSEVLKLCCDVCNETFPNYEELAFHRDKHIGQPNNIHPSIYHCALCEMVHPSENNLKNHIQQAHDLKIVSCDDDNVKRPLSTANLDDDNTLVLDPCKEEFYETQPIFQCGECVQNFNNETELEDHKHTHNDDRRYKCEICGKSFGRSDVLQNHMLVHTNERPYKCEICPKTFNFKTSFNAHMRSHTQGCAFKCKFCQKSLYSKKKLMDHESLHTGEFPFVCDVCPEKFKTFESFKVHMYEHGPVHPHVCDICNKRFYHKKSLAIHQRICQGSPQLQPQPQLSQDLTKANDSDTNYSALSKKEATEKKKYSYMSRRQRKTNNGISDFNALVNAIKEVKLQYRKAFTVAREYQIPHASFYRYISKLDKKNLDFTKLTEDQLLKAVKEVASFSTHHMVFKDKEEETLIVYILRCCSHYYGLSSIELRQLAYQFARKIQTKYPESWDEHQMAGFSWYYAFLDRHQNLLLRTPEQTSKSRIKSFCRENVEIFFRNLRKILSETAFQDVSIYNMDEIGLSTFGKVISLKVVKRVGEIAAQDHNNIATMALAVNAAGNSIPPFFLFPRKNMLSTFMEGASKNAVGFANDTGWMQQSEFIKFMKHFILHSQSSKTSPTLLLLDNHASHLSVEAIDIANANGVIMLSFPPHCSHRMQPLEISVFGPLKIYYTSEYSNWLLTNNDKVFELRHIAGFVTIVLEKILLPENIVAGFKSVGIHPFNPNVFTDADFATAKSSGENARISTVEKEYDEMEQRRIYVSTN